MIEETPVGNRLTGIFLGTVIQHLTHGMLKVYIPSVYPIEWKDKPEMLPACMQVVPQFAGNNSGNGVFSYPNIGSTVVCQFANGDQNLPMTFGSIQGGNDAIHQYNIIDKIDDIETIENGLSDDNYVHDQLFESVQPIQPSIMHRIESGPTSLTFFEDGKISADITVPIQTHVSALTEELTSTQLVMSQDGSLTASTNDYQNQITSNFIMNIVGNVHHDTIDNNSQVTCLVDMNTNGTIVIDAKTAGGYSIVTMTKDGVMTIDTTDKLDVTTTNKVDIKTTDATVTGKSSIALTAPKITINGSSSVDIAAPTVNVNGGGGDVVIAGTSLENHTHPVPAHCPNPGITKPPVP